MCICIRIYDCIKICKDVAHHMNDVQPIADRVAQHLEIVSKTFPTNQNSAHGMYD